MSAFCDLKELTICKEKHNTEYIRGEIMDIVRSKLEECDCNKCKIQGREHTIIRVALHEHGNCLADFINSHLHCRVSSVEQILEITKVHKRLGEQMQTHVKDLKRYTKETYGSNTEIDTFANDEHIETIKKHIDCGMIKAFDELSEILLTRWDEAHVQAYLDHLKASEVSKEEPLTKMTSQ